MIKIVNRSKGFGSKSNESKKSLRSKIESARLLKALKERRLEALKSRRLEAKKNERLDRLKKMVARKQNEKKAINRRTKKNEEYGVGYSIEFELAAAPQELEVKTWDYDLEEYSGGLVAHFNTVIDTYTLDFDWIVVKHPEFEFPLHDKSFNVTDAYFEDLEVSFTVSLDVLLSEEDLEELNSVREDIEFTDSNSKYMKMLRSKIRYAFNDIGKTMVDSELESMFNEKIVEIHPGLGRDNIYVEDQVYLIPGKNSHELKGYFVSSELSDLVVSEHELLEKEIAEQDDDEE